MPLYGDWKSIIRVQSDRQLAAIPVFLPADSAIPAPGGPGASPSFRTREVVTDKEVLQREVKDDVPGWTWTAATGFIGLMYLGFLIAIAIGVGRVGRAAAGDIRPKGERSSQPSGTSAAPAPA